MKRKLLLEEASLNINKTPIHTIDDVISRISENTDFKNDNEIQVYFENVDLNELQTYFGSIDYKKLDKNSLRTYLEMMDVINKVTVIQTKIMDENKLHERVESLGLTRILASSLTQEIYWAAKRKNTNALQQIKNRENFCWEDFNKGKWNDNPILLLAAEGDTESVNLLINQFPFSIKDAVLGFAIAGHQLIIDDEYLIKWALQGYAMHSHHEKVNELFAKYPHLINWVVLGYAIGGFADKVKEFIAKGASRHWAMMGYAIGQHDNEVDKLAEEGVSRDWAVRGYAETNQFKKAEEELKKGATNAEILARYYAIQNQIDQLNTLFDNICYEKKNKMQQAIIKGYAMVGNVNRVIEILKENNYDKLFIQIAMQAYEASGYDNLANTLENHVQDILEQDLISRNIIEPSKSKIKAEMLRNLRNSRVIGRAEKGENVIFLANSQNALYILDVYLVGGYIELAKELIEKVAIPVDDIIFQYAYRGYITEVNELILNTANQVDPHLLKLKAINGYAMAKDIDQVNKLIAIGADLYTKKIDEKLYGRMLYYAIDGYKEAGLCEKENLLRLLAFTHDLNLKENLAKKHSDDSQSILKKAGKISELMEKHKINFKQAQVLMNEEVSEWLLLGSHIIESYQNEIINRNKSTTSLNMCHAITNFLATNIMGTPSDLSTEDINIMTARLNTNNNSVGYHVESKGSDLGSDKININSTEDKIKKLISPSVFPIITHFLNQRIENISKKQNHSEFKVRWQEHNYFGSLYASIHPLFKWNSDVERYAGYYHKDDLDPNANQVILIKNNKMEILIEKNIDNKGINNRRAGFLYS